MSNECINVTYSKSVTVLHKKKKMSAYKYILEPYKGMRTRYKCPQCGGKGRFTRYINTDTGIYISEIVGRCDRENNCNYHYTPSSFFSDNPNTVTVTLRDSNTSVTPVTAQTGAAQYIPFEIMEKSVMRYERANIFPFLTRLFTAQVAAALCLNYLVGSNKYNNTVFWQVDIDGNIRQAKVMQYDPHTGRRNKERGAFFAGKKILNDDQALLQQCFFGENLLHDEENIHKPVAIVESEKTAVIASVYYKDFVWLATGGKTGCKWTEAKVCKVLAKRKVILFPDIGAFDQWKIRGELLSAVAGCKVAVSDILEKHASMRDKEKGLDLADYLLRVEDGSGLALTDEKYPVIWDYKIEQSCV